VRELTFVEPGKLEWREAPDAAIQGDGEAIVRPVAVATCDLDTALIAGRVPYRGPFAFGHECVAEVVEVGESVSAHAPGDLVSVAFQIYCGECDACREGRSASCTTTPPMAMYGLSLGGEWGGFLSDTVRVPFAEAMMVTLPEGVEPAAAASVSDNISDAWRTVGPQLAKRPGAAVLVCAGAGSIDLYAAGIAAALGAERVDYVGGRPDSAELARTMGANVIEGEFPERLGPYPITVDASGERLGLACALRSTEPDGICTSVGIYYEPSTPVPLLEMYTKGITFQTGRAHAAPAIPAVLRLIADGRLDPNPVTRSFVEWDDAPEALSEHLVKTVISR
jgi:threonine dehydrogenase-like Zn-dependent dehydrogenase